MGNLSLHMDLKAKGKLMGFWTRGFLDSWVVLKEGAGKGQFLIVPNKLRNLTAKFSKIKGSECRGSDLSYYCCNRRVLLCTNPSY